MKTIADGGCDANFSGAVAIVFDKTTFLDLRAHRRFKEQEELRHLKFVESLTGAAVRVRFDIAHEDFKNIEGSSLAYRQLEIAGSLFHTIPPLMPTFGRTRSGLNTTEIERFVRNWWEIGTPSTKWVLFAKGGDFNRFYTDWHLVLDWENDGEEFKQIVAQKYGSASRFVKSEEDYFKEGITWIQTTVLGISARVLPPKGVFGVASPTFFPNDAGDRNYLLGVMNSEIFDMLAHAVAARNWGATAIGSIPVPRPTLTAGASIAQKALEICAAKTSWDEGNEVSTVFREVWLLREDFVGSKKTISDRLNQLIETERCLDNKISLAYDALNSEVYSVYKISEIQQREIKDILGSRPPELIWPQMEGKTPEQKQMEHSWRLLSFIVKRVVENDADGIVPFVRVGDKVPLIDRVRSQIALLFPDRDVSVVEVEISNELKRRIKGYDRAESIQEWLENSFFQYHIALYDKRPIFWHISSKQGKGACAFDALIHYHRFDKEGMAKLRSTFLREIIGTLRREAAMAGQDGRTEDRLELHANLEEAQNLDQRLQWIQEGLHGGSVDYRILPSWKPESERPNGWNPDINDGIKVNLEPLQRAGVLRIAEVA